MTSNNKPSDPAPAPPQTPKRRGTGGAPKGNTNAAKDRAQEEARRRVLLHAADELFFLDGSGGPL